MRRGFTLLELSIVLVIIALVTGMAVTSGISVVASARISATQQRMKAIDDALMQFRVANDRLPCPADLTLIAGGTNFGIEAGGSSVCTTATGTCSGKTTSGTCIGTNLSPVATNVAAGSTFTTKIAAEGALPVVTLGLPNDFMLDGWGRKFRYVVDTGMTAVGAFHDSPLNNTCGPNTIQDANNNVRSSDAIYALISHGKNGHGGYAQKSSIMATGGSSNANELINCHCDTSASATSYSPTYVQAPFSTLSWPYTLGDYQNFDDLVTYKERWQMQTSWDSLATYYIADYTNYRIRKIQGCIITTIAGNGTASYGGDGGPATASMLNLPFSVAVDSNANVYIADTLNNRIREITVATGIISTVAGNGTAGYTGDGGLATSAELNQPYGIAVDTSGNLYIADTTNKVVRKVTAGTGIITTVAGNGTSTYTGDGSVATATGLGTIGPGNVALDASGNFYIATTTLVFKVTVSTGIITTVAGNGSSGYSGDGGAATAATIHTATGIALDGNGNTYIADSGNDVVRKVTASTGIITTIAGNGTAGYSGDGSPATSAKMNPVGVAVDNAGNLYIADPINKRVRMVSSSTGVITTIAGTGASGYSGDGNAATSGKTVPWGMAIYNSR